MMETAAQFLPERISSVGKGLFQCQSTAK